MNKVSIPLHSFVDLITNSSSEVFVEPTEKTKDVIYDIIDLLLKREGIDKKSRDIADVWLYVLSDVFNESTQRYEERQVYEGDVEYDASCKSVYLEVVVRPEYENIKKFTDLLSQLVGTVEGVSKYC